MNERWHTCEQRSDEWHRLRLGKVGGSRIADVVAKTKDGKWAASRANLAAELVLERLTGKPTIGFVSQAMQYGIEKEPEARNAYAFMFDTPVAQIGYVDHPTIPNAGVSPDGVVGTVGLVEIKVPQPAGHLDTLLTKTIEGRYLKQMQFQMATTGRKWCDFVSYQPTFPDSMRLFVKRVFRDEEKIAELERELRVFLTEVDRKVESLRAEFELERAA